MTPNDFKSSKFKLGPFAKYFYVAAAFFNAIVFAVQVSPFFFPVTAETFNFVSNFVHDSRSHLLIYSAISVVGWSHFGCNHHLRDLELVVHPRRQMASQGTGG